VEPKAKGEFLKKISINGFSLQETGNRLILRPRGAEATAQIVIEEVKPNTWIVMSAAGDYAGYGRGKKRLVFEHYIEEWVTESLLQTGELPGSPQSGP
jgi:hypothetical protein